MRTFCDVWYRPWAADCGEWARPASRVLVLLTTLLSIVMPVTEHLCNWDRFLYGGPDVEFSALAGLLFAAMIVLAMHGTMLQPSVMHPESMRSARARSVPCRRDAVGFARPRILISQWRAGAVPGLRDRVAAVPLRI